MADDLGIAVLGCGYWGVNYVRVFSELLGAHAVIACDQRKERLQEIAQRFPSVQTTSDITAALQTPGVQAAVVCTEATSHYAVTQLCLQAHRHVLVEKPLTTTALDADELIRLAQANGVTLMVGHTFIYNPAIRKIKEYMTLPETGQVYYLYSCRTNLGPIRRDVNAIWDLAPHDVAIFNYLLGSAPQWVSAIGAKVLRNHREDVGFITLGYPGNVVGHIHVSWADPNKVREVVVVGSHRRIVFNDLNNLEQVRIFEKGVTPQEEPSTYGDYNLLIRDGDIISPRIAPSEPLKNQCNHFLECVRTGRYPDTDGGAGKAVVQVMEAIDFSMQQNGSPIQLAKEVSHEYHVSAASALR